MVSDDEEEWVYDAQPEPRRSWINWRKLARFTGLGIAALFGALLLTNAALYATNSGMLINVSSKYDSICTVAEISCFEGEECDLSCDVPVCQYWQPVTLENRDPVSGGQCPLFRSLGET